MFRHSPISRESGESGAPSLAFPCLPPPRTCRTSPTAPPTLDSWALRLRLILWAGTTPGHRQWGRWEGLPQPTPHLASGTPSAVSGTWGNLHPGSSCRPCRRKLSPSQPFGGGLCREPSLAGAPQYRPHCTGGHALSLGRTQGGWTPTQSHGQCGLVPPPVWSLPVEGMAPPLSRKPSTNLTQRDLQAPPLSHSPRASGGQPPCRRGRGAGR